MNIKKALFVKGIVKGRDSWDPTKPQVAFYGRSNAGKSSSLNALVNNKTFAKISAAPGKTKEINLFNINDSFYLLDLPGYGYARGSKKEREKLDDLITWFICDTQADKRVHVVVSDAQVGLTQLDIDTLEFLYRTQEPIILLLNKIDKLNQSEMSKVLNVTRTQVAGIVDILLFSAKTKKGTEQVWKAIQQHL
jgi:GTP-binding protein